MAENLPNHHLQVIHNKAGRTIDVVARPPLLDKDTERVLKSLLLPKVDEDASSKDAQVFRFKSSNIVPPDDGKAFFVRAHLSRVLQASNGIHFALEMPVIERFPKGQPIVPKVHM